MFEIVINLFTTAGEAKVLFSEFAQKALSIIG